MPPVVDWAQAGPQFFEVWGRPTGAVDAEHMSVYGRSGSGKTYFLTYVMTMRARLRRTHAVYLATKKADETLTSAGWPVIDDWPPNYGEDQVIYWVRGGLSEDQQAVQRAGLVRITNTLWQPEANKIVGWDELPYVCADLKMRPTVATYYREGRGLGITNVAALQRPNDVTRYVHSEAGWTISFALKDADDRDRVGEVFGDRMYYREVIKRLNAEKHQFVMKRELTGEAIISALPSTRPRLLTRKEREAQDQRARENARAA